MWIWCPPPLANKFSTLPRWHFRGSWKINRHTVKSQYFDFPWCGGGRNCEKDEGQTKGASQWANRKLHQSQTKRNRQKLSRVLPMLSLLSKRINRDEGGMGVGWNRILNAAHKKASKQRAREKKHEKQDTSKHISKGVREKQGQRTQNEINTFDQIGESKTMVYRSGRSGLLSSLRS